jgi:hypothetical protein
VAEVFAEERPHPLALPENPFATEGCAEVKPGKTPMSAST